ncbi:hypothetical protein SAMN05444406_10940 [Caldicoprobacter faecalis]|uniref:Homing endonuclease LAGLIDADG domain-containing protein n=1 Tax=Caldicoprobacter faecalis TaxID=937334 RepID=A0A1I5V231_9FIRM|nr:hypothetical protein SAMN05444406_10940 [Caldicoprobacter faecalis]
MTPEESTYVAGIIDGEGSIMLIRFHNNQNPAPCVSISSALIELLKWIKKLQTRYLPKFICIYCKI